MKNIIVGLTGPTGAGKSILSPVAEKLGFKVIDCDTVARRAVEKGTEGLKVLTEVFGKDILFYDGCLDRKALAKKAFSSKENTELLNTTLLPFITDLIKKETQEGNFLLDAPTLFESGADSLCVKTVAVLSDWDLRLERIIERDGISEEDAILRMNAGKPDKYYKQKADYTVYNNGDIKKYSEEFSEILKNIIKELHIMENLSAEALKKELFRQPKNGRSVLNDEQLKKCDEYCEGYKAFLNDAKTEREAVKTAVRLAKEKGFCEFEAGKKYNPGDKVYVNNRGKSAAFIVIGKNTVDNGINISAAHIDSPRLDLKPNPLYEETELALFKTHYYGGIKKYQWTAVPLALHGVFALTDGSVVEVCCGEKEDEPKFVINDLLPHLAQEQIKRPANEVVRGEELNVLVGSHPFRDDKESELVKLNILKILNEKYGIKEEDFLSAELEMVPAYKACDLGFDRSLVGAYGQDDRVCAYPALTAVFDVEMPEKTAMAVLADKEEIGSMGNTGLESSFLRYTIYDLAKMQGVDGTVAVRKSKCLSADVNAAVDPTFQDVIERRNAAFLNYGVVLTKYTGARGKSGTSDASAEFVASVRAILDREKVLWQSGELGRVDLGGGGTVAMFIADMGIDVVDLGVPVLSMHAPFETTSKLDIYMCYRAMYEFMK